MDENLKESGPALKVSPVFLDFGILEISRIKKGRHSVVIEITNSGGGVLGGKLIPQVDWIVVTPDEIRLAEKQTIEHEVLLTSKFPYHWNKRKYTFDGLIIINTNGGSVSLGGTYITVPGQARPRVAPGWILALVGLILAGLISIPILARFVYGRSMADVQIAPEIYYTQGALTAYAILTRTAESLVTVTRPPSVTPLSTPMPGLVRNLTPAQTPTYTPWPRAQFPNPEQVIRDYYDGLNKRQYERTWAMLTDYFQQECCVVAGNQPFIVYQNYWNGVEKVEVIYAYLQQWDANPAVVNVALRYTFKRGDKTEGTFVFKLIADAERKALLIDQVK